PGLRYGSRLPLGGAEGHLGVIERAGAGRKGRDVTISERQFQFSGADGTPIAGYHWVAEDVTPHAVLQVAHGMGEHAGRYREPLEPLMRAGWVIYASDHRGHGLTAPRPEALGDFGEKGAELVVEDLHKLTTVIHG